MMIATAASTTLPLLPLLGGAVLLLVPVLVVVSVLVRRRRRPTADDLLAGHLPGDRIDEVPAPSAETQIPDDPRAVRLLVRTLEATIHDLSADLARASSAERVRRSPIVSSTPTVPTEPVAVASPDPVAAPPAPTGPGAPGVQVISQALQGAGTDDLPARLHAALARRGAPLDFARPHLAACLESGLPTVRPVPDLSALPTPPEAADTLAHDDAPATEVVLVAVPEDVPTEPERVLPVPAPAAPPPAPRRRLFRRTVA